MVKKLAVGLKADDIILSKVIKLKKHLVVVIPTIHGKGCFSKESCALFHSFKSDGICGFITFFRRGMDSGKDTDWMIAFCKDTGFCDMIPFLVNIFSGCAFGTIPNNAKSFKFITIWFYNVTVINVNNRFRRNPFFNRMKIGYSCLCRNSFVKMSGKAVNNIYLLRILVELVNDIC
ncbi:hypothetical protein BN3456_00045 [Clostridium sp. C105KSO13]|nr:hypothetical protein BN3456_00045 [Clostridium sp. C105KSO13]